MKTCLFNKSVYIDPDLEIKELKESLSILKRYGILNIKFLLDGGLFFEYLDELDAKFNYFGDISFVKEGNIIVSFSENFGSLEFRNVSGELITNIKIINEFSI